MTKTKQVYRVKIRLVIKVFLSIKNRGNKQVALNSLNEEGKEIFSPEIGELSIPMD